MVSWPESSCSSSETLKHTFLMPPWSVLSTSLSSLTGGEDEVSSTKGGSQRTAEVGSVMVDSSLPEQGKGAEGKDIGLRHCHTRRGSAAPHLTPWGVGGVMESPSSVFPSLEVLPSTPWVLSTASCWT